MFSLPDKSLVNTSFNSRSAAGCTPSRVAMRSTTSLRRRSVKCPRISQAWSRSRWTRMVAMICGCSLRISSATDGESIHFRLSMPDASLPPRTRDSSTEALSSPSALVRTWRMYSSESRPTVEAAATSSRKPSSTSTTCSCGTPFIVAIAAPSFSTSRGPRNFITSAASDSPIASIRIAAFCSPVLSVICAYPCFDHVRDDARVLGGQLLRQGQVVAVGPRRVFFHFGTLLREEFFFRRAGRLLDDFLFRFRLRRIDLVDLLEHGTHHRTHHPHQDVQQDQGRDEELRQFLRHRQVGRIAPPVQGRLGRLVDAVERGVGHADGVAAVLVVAHRFAHQAVDLGQLVGRQGAHGDLAVGADDAAVVHHHAHRHALQAGNGLLLVAHRLVDFVIGRRFLVHRRAGHGGTTGRHGAGGRGRARGAVSSGAVATPGGWFDSAPGTPFGLALALPLVSVLCWLRMADGAGDEFGLYDSAACSMAEKSTSATASARTLPSPTMGLTMFSTCLMTWFCSSCA